MDHDQEIADLDRIANGNPDALHGALAGRPKLVLHLHRLDDEHLLAGLDAVTGGHRDGHDATRDDRPDLDWPTPRGRTGTAARPLAEDGAAFELQLHLDPPPVHDNLAEARPVGAVDTNRAQQ